MSRVMQNKLQKRSALLESAYSLFKSNGFSKTTIQDIAENAGIAKGTFYLYFKDKHDIRDALVRSKATNLINDACEYLDVSLRNSGEDVDVADKFICIIDYIVDKVSSDEFMLRYISKNLLWGLVSAGPRTPQDYLIKGQQIEPDYSFVEYIQTMLANDNVEIRDLNNLLFILLELISSITYDLVTYNQPMTLEEFKPYLHHTISVLVNDAIVR